MRVTGLYTILLPMVAFGLLGASRHLVIAADSATAAVLASSLVAVAALGSPEYVGLTSAIRAELDRRGVGFATVAIPEGVLTEPEIYRALAGKSGRHEIFTSVDDAIRALSEFVPNANRHAQH